MKTKTLIFLALLFGFSAVYGGVVQEVHGQISSINIYKTDCNNLETGPWVSVAVITIDSANVGIFITFYMPMESNDYLYGGANYHLGLLQQGMAQNKNMWLRSIQGSDYSCTSGRFPGHTLSGRRLVNVQLLRD